MDHVGRETSAGPRWREQAHAALGARTFDSAHPVFFQNLFCLIPRHRLAFVVISRNASTFLTRVALMAAEGVWPTGSASGIHEWIGYRASAALVPVDEMADYVDRCGQPWTRFAVWRDPISRIESTYSYFVLRDQPRAYFRTMDLTTSAGFLSEAPRAA